MAFKFQYTTANAAGTFNIYSLQHRWLADVKLIEVSEEDFVQLDLYTPEVRLHSKKSPVVWMARPTLLTVWSATAGHDCGKDLGAALKQMPWTPLTGVGSAASFVADGSIVEELSNSLPVGPKPSGFAVLTRGWSYALLRGGQKFDFQVLLNLDPADGQESVSLSVNVHTDIPRELKLDTAIEIAQQACGDYRKHISEALELASDLLKVKVVM